MRFEFFAAMLAAQTIAFQIESEDQTLPQIGTEYDDEFQFAQLLSEIEEDEQLLAQTHSRSRSHSHSRSHSKSDSESGSGSGSGSKSGSNSSSGSRSSGSNLSQTNTESESDSDADFGTLELAQQIQELKMINAMGVINQAQINGMQ